MSISQPFRLVGGGRIDRRRRVDFRFNGLRFEGYRGDTLASALLANGVRTVGRSIKHHRRRGFVGAGVEEPNGIFTVRRAGVEGSTIPHAPGTVVELVEGLEAYAVNGWPSLRFDLAGGLRWFGGMLPAGFYYKTFMWPRAGWRWYEWAIRRMAGNGRAPDAPDPDRYDKRNAFCDVLVVGGGPAGLAASLAAGATGAFGAAKRLLHTGWTETLETQMELEAQAIAARAHTADGNEGIRAFLEKRAPTFHGK